MSLGGLGVSVSVLLTQKSQGPLYLIESVSPDRSAASWWGRVPYLHSCPSGLAMPKHQGLEAEVLPGHQKMTMGAILNLAFLHFLSFPFHLLPSSLLCSFPPSCVCVCACSGVYVYGICIVYMCVQCVCVCSVCVYVCVPISVWCVWCVCGVMLYVCVCVCGIWVVYMCV